MYEDYADFHRLVGRSYQACQQEYLTILVQWPALGYIICLSTCNASLNKNNWN